MAAISSGGHDAAVPGGIKPLLVENYMAANTFDVFVSVSVCVCLGRGSFEGPPGVEAACEAVGLVSLPHQPQLPGVFSVLRAHVLDVNLERGGRRRI